jgi:hypothetical protein
MQSAKDKLDRATLLKILVRELGDVVDLALMSNCDDLAKKLQEALIESKTLYTEALIANRS